MNITLCAGLWMPVFLFNLCSSATVVLVGVKCWRGSLTPSWYLGILNKFFLLELSIDLIYSVSPDSGPRAMTL